jgi:hypothetical protein
MKADGQAGASPTAWLKHRAWSWRWATRSRWLQFRGATGDFASGEASDRAQRLSQMWDLKWAGSQLIGHRLRHDHPERWVRFHSLPGSKRYADTAQERSEIVRRHRSVLDELRQDEDISSLAVIATDYGPRDLATGWTKKHLIDAWAWRSYLDPDDPEIPVYFWVTSNLNSNQLDDLLLQAADDRAHVVLTSAELDWLYYPCDGGADVVAATSIERDALRDRDPNWLPDNIHGL